MRATMQKRPQPHRQAAATPWQEVLTALPISDLRQLRRRHDDDRRRPAGRADSR
jgi:hypothetical protein